MLHGQHEQGHEHLHEVAQQPFVLTAVQTKGGIVGTQQLVHPVFRTLLIGVRGFCPSGLVVSQEVFAVVLRLDGQVAFLRHLGKVGSGIDPLQLVVGRDIDDTQVKMLTRGACARVAGHAQFLSCIDHIAFLDGNFTQVHILHTSLGAILTGVFHSDCLAATCGGAMVNTNDSTVVLRGQHIVLVGLDVNAMMDLRRSLVDRVFTWAIGRGDKHELVTLHRHGVACASAGRGSCRRLFRR